MSGHRTDQHWPAPLGDAAYHGVAGEILSAVEPHTEGDPAAVLLQLLAAFGNALGHTAHWIVGPTKHHGNLFVVIVGPTSSGRKGTSWAPIETLMGIVDPDWAENCVHTGLSSGEGLIEYVRDERVEKQPIKDKGRVVDYQDVVVDHGVADKRALIFEGEFGSVLRMKGRDGNVVADVCRNAWDGRRLGVMTRSNPLRATGAHISIVGQITIDELVELLGRIDAASGFANRFLFVAARRSKSLPFGGEFHKVNLAPLVKKLDAALTHGKQVGAVPFSGEAAELWGAGGIYERLENRPPGVFGALTSRGSPQVRRVAMLYALLDCSAEVTVAHLRAALEVWRYVEDSTRMIFGGSTGNRVADQIHTLLSERAPSLVTRSEIRDRVGTNRPADQIEEALSLLEQCGMAAKGPDEAHENGGRPAERWGVSSLSSFLHRQPETRGLVETNGHPPLGAGLLAELEQIQTRLGGAG